MAEPYKIILVDDEDEIRGRISSKITPESGFVVVGTAGNGYDALELIERLAPQVVLTDIRMPYIDGIELAGIIRREHPTVRIGFITGYDEFDYARQAIKLNVRSYLTKPLTQEEISGFLSRLKDELDEEYRDNYNRERMRERYERSLPLLVENYFVSLLASGGAGSERDVEEMRQCGVCLDDTRYILAFALVERNPEHWGAIEFEQLKLSVRGRLGALLTLEEFEHYDFMFRDGIAYVVKEKGSDFGRAVDVVLDRMARTTEHFLSVRLDVGVSGPHSGFGQLRQAWDEAGEALARGRYNPVSHVTYHSELGGLAANAVKFREGDAISLEHALRYGTEGQLEATLASLKESAARDSPGAGNIGLYVVGAVGVVADYAASMGQDLNEAAGADVIETMAGFRSLDQLFAWVAMAAAKIRERSRAAKAGNAERMLERAIATLRRDYADPDLTMDKVCDELGISASYLGQLFKKYKDSSFVRFLTGVRIDKAKELLSTTGDRVVEIALACGYRDAYYFSHSFKKVAGVSPKRYRESHA